MGQCSVRSTSRRSKTWSDRFVNARAGMVCSRREDAASESSPQRDTVCSAWLAVTRSRTVVMEAAGVSRSAPPSKPNSNVESVAFDSSGHRNVAFSPRQQSRTGRTGSATLISLRSSPSSCPKPCARWYATGSSPRSSAGARLGSRAEAEMRRGTSQGSAAVHDASNQPPSESNRSSVGAASSSSSSLRRSSA
jgi:hypothetical protein